MRKAIVISLFVLVFFLVEFILFNSVGRWFMPNLLLLAIVYFNMAFGIRYSLFTALLAGILKDSFSAGIFGMNIFAFIACAFATTYLKKYLHYVASRQSRLILVFFVVVVHVAVMLCLQVMFGKVDPFGMFKSVFIPEVLATLLVTTLIFTQMKKCVLKLFA